MRVRYWNAYLLFYEAVKNPKQLSIPRRVSDSSIPLSPLPPHGEDKLQQLQVRDLHDLSSVPHLLSLSLSLS